MIAFPEQPVFVKKQWPARRDLSWPQPMCALANAFASRWPRTHWLGRCSIHHSKD